MFLKRTFFASFLLNFSLLVGATVGKNQFLLKKAVKLYDAGHYGESSQKFQQLLNKVGHNGHLFYNLGNAEFRQNHLGRSIAAYLAAKRYLPRDPDVTANLNYALSRGKTQINFHMFTVGGFAEFFFWIDDLNRYELFSISMGVLIVLFLCLGFHFWFNRRSWLLKSSLILSILAVALWSSFFVKILLSKHLGSVVVKNTYIYSGPNIQNMKIFKLHEGNVFARLEATDHWTKIQILGHKEKGWVESSHVLIY